MRCGGEPRPINCTLDFHAGLAKALGQPEVAAAGAKWLGSAEVLEREEEQGRRRRRLLGLEDRRGSGDKVCAIAGD